MIYRILRALIRKALSIFYYRIEVTGKEFLRDKGPLIIASNHPNTLMDPLVIASLMRQRIGFLGNGGLFQNKVLAAFLRFFHVIPIYRKKDIKEGQKVSNQSSFQACHEYFDKGGSILIFPEGSSYYELNLREIKTGTARIALSYEQLHGFKSKLKILPIALDYSDSLLFRSVLVIRIGEPIEVGAFQGDYQQEEILGIRALTEGIRGSLAKSIPLTDDKESEAFLKNIHRFYATFFLSEAKLYADPLKSLDLRRSISRAIMVFKKEDFKKYDEIRTNVESFFQILQKEKLSAGFFTDDFQNKNSSGIYLSYFLQLLILLPIYLFGLLTNYLPYILPTRFFNLLKIDKEYKTSFALITGILFFPIFYGIQIWAFQNWFDVETIYILLFALFLPISGYVAMYYWRVLGRFSRLIKYGKSKNSEASVELINLRNKLIRDIEKVRDRLQDSVNTTY